MRKSLTSLIKTASTTDKDKSVLVSVILIETTDGIDLHVTREEATLGPGQKVKTDQEESVTLSQLTTDQIVTVVELVDSWLESESHPTFFETIEDVDGTYEREEQRSMRGTPPRVEHSFDALAFRVGPRAIELGFFEDDEWEGVEIPSGEVIDSGQAEDFRNVLTFSHVFYDFFRTRYTGEVPELELENPVSLDRGAVEKVELLFERFGHITRQLANRSRDRPPLQMDDEYDVQYLLHALLRLYFDDIRDENYLKRHAGVSPRIDFLLEDENIGIETKRVRANSHPKKIRTELAEDKEHYRSDTNCETLLCFIYDPDRYLTNPAEFEKDLSETTDNLTTRVTVNQT
ncbi:MULTISPECIES: hypothetical protein [Haloferacaceae]|uniref:Uncharacterized protein n=1 Tax=Halorubrum glutamatedens TaxID=2707018 RepID=A0ABD5QMM5_9EURY|nr:hypothetical protein [Halobellus captivus]